MTTDPSRHNERPEEYTDQPVDPHVDEIEEFSEDEKSDTPPQRVLLFQAHPDDAEFVCSGTIARWASEGAEIHYCSLTSGDKGSEDPTMTGERLATTREQEQRNACDILGVQSVTFLRYLDATLVPDLEMRKMLTRVIRQVRPDVMLCQDPTVRYRGQGYINHPDHIAAGEAALAAVFPSARDRMTFPDLFEIEGLEPHKVEEIYIYGAQEPDVWVDISDHIETKVRALKAHATQIRDWDPTDMLYDWARETASSHSDRPNGFGEFAESFKYFRLG